MICPNVPRSGHNHLLPLFRRPISYHCRRSITTNTDSFITAPPPPRHDGYQATIKRFDMLEGTKVMIVGSTEKEVRRYRADMEAYGTKVVASLNASPGSAGNQDLLKRVQQDNQTYLPYAADLLATHDANLLSILPKLFELSIPLIVCTSTGWTDPDQAKTTPQHSEIISHLKSQSHTRLIGPSSGACLILPHSKIWLGEVDGNDQIKSGPVGFIGTRSTKLSIGDDLSGSLNVAQYGFSAIFGGVGKTADGHETGTEIWEVMEWLLSDDATKVILFQIPLNGSSSLSPSEAEATAKLISTINHYVSSHPENQKLKPLIAICPPQHDESVGGSPSEDWRSVKGVRVLREGKEVGEVVGEMLESLKQRETKE